MGKNLIVSEETVRDLLEAHASLSAWYYELWAALRAGNASPRTPDDAARAAFVERLAADFPEIASVARSIRVPRMFVPPPPTYAAAPPAADADLTSAPAAPATAATEQAQQEPEPQPQQARARPDVASAPAAPAGPPLPAPPPLVNPSQVKYDK